MPPPALVPNRPLVTVVMAAYNAERYIAAALASLSRQTVGDIEVVVVDDGSTDATSEIVRQVARRDSRFRLVRTNRNRGQAAALNLGVEQARGRYLALLDADDEATPARLAHQLRAFESDPALVLAGGDVATWCDRYSAEGRVWRYAREDASIRARSLFKAEFISGAMTLDLDRLGRHRVRFDETVRVGADWALSIDAMRVGRVANVPWVVMRYRIHPGQLTEGMMDHLGSDSARIRADALARLGVQATEDEMRIHLAVSPCNYWPVGAHPYFRARRPSILEDARRWFERLKEANARTGSVPREALEAYLDEILFRIARCLAVAERWPGEEPFCPVAHPVRCVAGEPCR